MLPTTTSAVSATPVLPVLPEVHDLPITVLSPAIAGLLHRAAIALGTSRCRDSVLTGLRGAGTMLRVVGDPVFQRPGIEVWVGEVPLWVYASAECVRAAPSGDTLVGSAEMAARSLSAWGGPRVPEAWLPHPMQVVEVSLRYRGNGAMHRKVSSLWQACAKSVGVRPGYAVRSSAVGVVTCTVWADTWNHAWALDGKAGSFTEVMGLVRGVDNTASGTYAPIPRPESPGY